MLWVSVRSVIEIVSVWIDSGEDAVVAERDAVELSVFFLILRFCPQSP
jgi:hypothetical protein